MSRKTPIAVIKAAEARALGNSWEAAASASGWPLDQLRRWIRKRHSQWDRVLFRARRDARDSACDEAVPPLRVHLRDKKSKPKIDAATAVANHFSLPESKRRPAKSQKASSESDKIHVTSTESELTELEKEIEASEEERKRREDGEQRDGGQKTEDGGCCVSELNQWPK